jgi:hypothetical protein
MAWASELQRAADSSFPTGGTRTVKGPNESTAFPESLRGKAT